MLKASIQKNDKTAYWLIGAVSLVVFAAVVLLKQIHLEWNVGFDVHIFARINALINSLVTLLLIAALAFVKQKKYAWHRNTMFAAILLSVLFLLSYIAHHLLSGNTPYGGQGFIRYVYYFILISHVFLAGIILPFILLTAYRGLTGEYRQHNQLAKITFPIWLYVSISGVVVYIMIAPYY
jgi:putative membrane protein